MSDELHLKEIQKEWHGTLQSYAIGFILSILLTVASFFLVMIKGLSMPLLSYAIVGLALAQATIQLLFFLHVGKESKPRLETMVLYFMVLVLLIIVIGSLWIMYDLNDRTMGNMTMEMPND